MFREAFLAYSINFFVFLKTLKVKNENKTNFPNPLSTAFKL